MAEMLLFHHVLGRTSGVEALADRWREHGHVVHVPDLFEGRTFATIDDGIAHVEAIGFGTVIERGVEAAAEVPAEVVYAGVSLGVLPAQRLAQTRTGCRGALLLEACAPVTEFGDTWPGGVPVQVHGMDADPFFAGEGDLDAARDLVARAEEGELFTYPGDRHLFTDAGLDAHDAEATGRVVARCAELLARIDADG